jgi:5'(3')-deoxyribonucleotidase
MNFPLLPPEELKMHLQALGRKGLALDIDETLSYTNRHWMKVSLDRLPLPEGYLREELLASNAPLETYWSEDVLLERLGDLLHSNEFNSGISIIENADHAVNEINGIVPILAYITARPVSVVLSTQQWLARHGFPEAPLIMMPVDEDHIKRNRWKANVLRLLYPEILGIVDDNPGLSIDLAENYAGMVFVYNSTVHPNQNERIIPCPDWDSVKNAVRSSGLTKQEGG